MDFVDAKGRSPSLQLIFCIEALPGEDRTVSANVEARKSIDSLIIVVIVVVTIIIGVINYWYNTMPSSVINLRKETKTDTGGKEQYSK